MPRAGSLAQVSDQPPQTFKESLLAASRTPSDSSSAHEDATHAGRRQNPATDAAKSPHAMLHSGVVPITGTAQQTLQQLVPPAQHLQVIDPVPVVPLQVPSAGAAQPPKAVAVAAGPARSNPLRVFPSIGSNVLKPDNIPFVDTQEKTDPSPVAPRLSPGRYDSETATNLASPVTTANQAAQVKIPMPSVDLDSSGIADSTQAAAPAAVQAVALPTASGTIQNAVTSTVQMAASAQSNAAAVPGNAQQQHPGADSTRTPDGPVKALSDTVSKVVLNAVPHVTSTETATVVQSSASSPTPLVSPQAFTHGSVNGSTKGEVAQKSNTGSVSQPDLPATPPSSDGPAAVSSVPGATADQLAALIRPNGSWFVTDPAHGLNMLQEKTSDAAVDSKGGAGKSTNEITGLNQHGLVDSVSASSQPVSQDPSPSGDQSQGSASQQGQNTNAAQSNLANHAVALVDHPQSASVAVLSQAAPAQAGVSAHTAKTPQTAPPSAVVVPQAAPVINTAKLIQSMGQSEMRVGMRSTDFGNISISTSTTRDLISAQISLDHGELARTLAAHLPEVQAKFGGNQAMDVRIDVTGQQLSGHSAGSSTSMSNESADHSRSNQQPRSGGPSRQSAEGFAGQLNSIPAAVLPLVDSRLDARLDIRV